MPGEVAAAAAFSFYPTKNLGALGDAGALVSERRRARSTPCAALRQHGERERYVHERIGYTARLDTLQAAVLLRKLPLLDEWNRQRRERRRALHRRRSQGVGDLRCLPVPAGSRPVWHLYPVRTARRAGRLPTFLAERGIDTGRHYPQPPHLSPAYAALGYRRGAFPVAERLAAELLSLPIFPGISERRSLGSRTRSAQYFRHGCLSRRTTRRTADRGRRVRRPTCVVHSFTNLYGCSIGDDTRIGPFVEIQRGAVIGEQVQDPEPHVRLRRRRHRGRGVRRPRRDVHQRPVPARDDADGELKTEAIGQLQRTTVERGAAIGSGAVILAGVRIGAERARRAPAPSSPATCRPGRSSPATRRASIAR